MEDGRGNYKDIRLSERSCYEKAKQQTDNRTKNLSATDESQERRF
jgi:hypothetical protein